MEHLERIKERIEKGEKLARKSYTNKDGIAYARKESKNKYLEIAKQLSLIHISEPTRPY